MAPPLVTIISPVYDQEQYVARCVESTLAQSYRHWEQVFVDDGSSDRTLEILATYRDPRIRVLTLPHRGLAALAASYNAALAATVALAFGAGSASAKRGATLTNAMQPAVLAAVTSASMRKFISGLENGEDASTTNSSAVARSTASMATSTCIESRPPVPGVSMSVRYCSSGAEWCTSIRRGGRTRDFVAGWS